MPHISPPKSDLTARRLAFIGALTRSDIHLIETANDQQVEFVFPYFVWLGENAPTPRLPDEVVDKILQVGGTRCEPCLKNDIKVVKWHIKSGNDALSA